MADIELVIKISEKTYKDIQSLDWKNGEICYSEEWKAIHYGTLLPKGHSFIAICDSDFPIAEEVRQRLKNTIFVGNEDCEYCFDMTEIIEADKAESEEEK